jgi:hypothetical protein
VTKYLLSILIAASALGCTSSFYQKWADKQVDAIVRDREKRTLDYTPQVEAETTVAAKPAHSAYEKVPPTPKPPPSKPARPPPSRKSSLSSPAA